MDLTHEVPRSPYEKLGGMVFLPRSIDKGRADLAGTLGEYVARTGRSERLFEFLGVSADEFIDALRDRPTDKDVWAWIAEHATPRTPEEIEEFNRWMWAASPEDEERSLDVDRIPGVPGGLRTRPPQPTFTRHFDRLDLDEGRDVPDRRASVRVASGGCGLSGESLNRVRGQTPLRSDAPSTGSGRTDWGPCMTWVIARSEVL